MTTPWETTEEREERLAGEEASQIGGKPGHQTSDPSRQAAQEAGGGESEGWEEAEEDLIQHASHGDDRSDTAILRRQIKEEKEGSLSTARYGEADQTPSSD